MWAFARLRDGRKSVRRNHTSWFAHRYYGFDEHTVEVNGFPLFHVAGVFCHGLAEISAGANILIPSKLGMRNQRFVADHWKVVERHRVWISQAWGGIEPTAEQFRGLADMYVADERFARHYGGADGANFVRDAIYAWTESAHH